jgi:hypothetical protein
MTPPATDIFLADLAVADGRFAVSAPRNLTARDGYDNQPAFSRDGGPSSTCRCATARLRMRLGAG